MLRVAVKYEPAIDSYSKSWYETLRESYLSPQDWEKLRAILAFLLPFYQATKATKGDHATIDRVLFTIDVLI